MKAPGVRLTVSFTTRKHVLEIMERCKRLLNYYSHVITINGHRTCSESERLIVCFDGVVASLRMKHAFFNSNINISRLQLDG